MQPDPAAPRGRSGGLALVATLIAPGLGHLYLGHPRVAFAVLLALGVGFPLLITAMVALQMPPLWTFATAVSAGWGFALAIAFDAYRRAGRTRDIVVAPGSGRGKYLGFFALSLAVSMTGQALRKEYVLDFHKTPSDSMAPTLRADDHFVVTKLHERGRTPARGDLVTFIYPQDPSEVFVKRVVAIGGDTVVDTPEGLVINGLAWPRRACDTTWPDELPEQCLTERAPDGREYTIRETPGAPARLVTTTVPEGQMWVRGDNRRGSHDSVTFGPVPVANVLGRVRAIVLPLDRLGPLE